MSGPSAKKVDGRLTFQEAMSLAPLQPQTGGDKSIKRFISQRAAWIPGSDLTGLVAPEDRGPGKAVPFRPSKLAYGGHVFSQAGMAATRAFADAQSASGSGKKGKQFGLHTIHGYFSAAGVADRPFVYEVTTLAPNPGFTNFLVTARQPTSPSTSPSGDHYPLADAGLPLGPICFSALVSFRPSSPSPRSGQEPSPQTRFSDVLGARPPSAWDPAPLSDIASITAALPSKVFGSFPAVEIRKVDLTALNAGKPLHERRELLLYRLIAPIPASEPNSHVLVHAFEADRNSVLMIGNHAGFGFNFGRAASLSYSFVVHVNAADAVMAYGEDEWWIQEATFPRVEAERGVLLSKIWSPQGLHVATEYQDGLVRPGAGFTESKGKL
ncbi:acyl-thioesterase [Xylariomycetidae sp. FL2044]|nr:acyl-thioesterase [Xylariomycetidae sp. FL2044]